MNIKLSIHDKDMGLKKKNNEGFMFDFGGNDEKRRGKKTY